MDLSQFIAQPRKVLSFKVVLYALPCPNHTEIYLDRQAAVTLAKAIDSINPLPLYLSVMYATFACGMMQDSRVQNSDTFILTDQDLLDRIREIIELVGRMNKIELYRVNIETALRYLELPGLEWEVTYQPSEEYDDGKREIQLYMESLLQSLHPLLEASQAQTEPVSTVVSPSTTIQESVQPESGYATPEEEYVSATPEPDHLPDEINLLLEELEEEYRQKTIREFVHCTPTSTRKNQKNALSLSQFTIVESQKEEDKQAASLILNKVKILAMDSSVDSQNRWSIGNEKRCIQIMSIDCSLNVGSHCWSPVEKLKRLFKLYDGKDPQGNESFQSALLMVTVKLLRHNVINKGKEKRVGQYVSDFEKMFPLPIAYNRQGNKLCRIIVACGHPCILVILVRLAIRNGISVSQLIDDLPIPQFCLWIATGRVSEASNMTDETCNSLQWLHSNVLLPLLASASQRVLQDLFLVDDTLQCNEDTCLKAIIHSTLQSKFSHLPSGQEIEEEDADWVKGKVLLEAKTIKNQVVSQYSIERKRRTFHNHQVAYYRHTEHFEDNAIPLLLKQGRLEMGQE